jgi:hypothetical protein
MLRETGWNGMESKRNAMSDRRAQTLLNKTFAGAWSVGAQQGSPTIWIHISVSYGEPKAMNPALARVG